MRVIDLLAPIANFGSPWSALSQPPLAEAYEVEISDRLAANRLSDAENLLEEYRSTVGSENNISLLEARILEARGDWDSAARVLQDAWRASPATSRDALRLAARRTVSRAAASDALAENELASLLEAQIAIDPDHAPLHAALGRLRYDAGRYAEALPALYRARGLDAARFTAELTPLIERAEARAYSPGLTVVPVYREGASLYVHATIPGSPRRLRFLLDTGASLTAVAPAALEGLSGVRARGSVRLQTANGTVDAPRITLPGLDVSGAVIRDLDVVVLDSLSGYDGLLGLSYLDNFDMELDRSGNRMILRVR
jgi:clan AA aspartic protease (TIGR02281 family)